MVISTETCVSKNLVQDDLWWHRGWGTPANKSSSSLLGSSWMVMRCMSFGAFTVSLAKEGSCPVLVVLHQCGSISVMTSVILEQSSLLPTLVLAFIYILLLFRLAFLSLLTYNVYTFILNTTLPSILVPLHMRSLVHTLYTDRYDLQISTPKNVLAAVRVWN